MEPQRALLLLSPPAFKSSGKLAACLSEWLDLTTHVRFIAPRLEEIDFPPSLRFVIVSPVAGWESFVECVANDESKDQVALLLWWPADAGSHGPAFRGLPSRIDGVIREPLFKRRLKAGLVQAYRNRLRRRDLVLYLGDRADVREAIRDALTKRSDQSWQRFLPFASSAALERLTESDRRALAAIFVNSEFLSPSGIDWLNRARAARAAELPIILSLERAGERVRRHHHLFDRFVEGPTSPGAWTALLKNLCLEADSVAPGLFRLETLRRALAEGSTASRLRALDAAVSLQRWRADLRLLFGRFLEGIGRSRRAVFQYRQALIVDPYLREAYLRLYALLSTEGREPELERLMRQMQRYAPTIAMRSDVRPEDRDHDQAGD